MPRSLEPESLRLTEKKRGKLGLTVDIKTYHDTWPTICVNKELAGKLVHQRHSDSITCGFVGSPRLILEVCDDGVAHDR